MPSASAAAPMRPDTRVAHARSPAAPRMTHDVACKLRRAQPMRAPTGLPLASLTVALLLISTEAEPCSLIPPAQTGGPSGFVGARPVLIAETAEAELAGPPGAETTLEPWTPPPELADARGARGDRLFYFRPREPLPEGSYTFDRGRVSFTVSATIGASIPEPRRGDLSLFIDDNPDDESGPLGCGSEAAGCGDVTSLVIALPDVATRPESPETFLVTLSTPDGRTFRRLVSDLYGFGARTELRFYHSFVETGHLSNTPLCLGIRGVSSEGEIGPPLELGCVDPDDGSDMRVSRAGGGCSSLGGARRVPTLALLALGLGLMRARRRR